MDCEIKIDEIDVQILKTVLSNPRVSFAEIARQCKMSTNAIRMRFKSLEEAGVITGAKLHVSPKILGFGCTASLNIQARVNDEESVYDYLQSIPSVFLCFHWLSKWNFNCVVGLKDTAELADLVEQIKRHSGVIDVQSYIWVEQKNVDFPKNLIIKPTDKPICTTEFLQNETNQKFAFITQPVDNLEYLHYLKESFNMDQTDLRILRILSENASIPFRKIAKQLDISTQSVIRRYSNLKKNLKLFSSTSLNLKKLGYESIIVLFITALPQFETSQVFDKLSQIPNVITLHKCFGSIDILAIAPLTNFKQLFDLKQRVVNTLGVKSIEISMGEPFSSWPLNPFASLFEKLSSEENQ
ncbi:MAG: AsnC family transcriptional regulator [Candidatus Bathyarchaeota archaeon]|nr:AsnC family transcriptional regulator [Candidatus Bathyarchaeum sp.]